MSRPQSLALCLALALASLASSGHAFVRSTTSNGTPVKWPNRCAWIFADTDPPDNLSLQMVADTLATAVANWQSPTAGLAYLQIDIDPPSAGEAHFDQLNIVKFRKDKWCRPAERKTAEICYSGDATAITTIFYINKPGDRSDGTILDADIELNTIDFTFDIEPSAEAPRQGTSMADLQNTLTHELGHFQGLDHTCWDQNGDTPQPIDNLGQPVPACSQLSSLPPAQREAIMSATMYNFSTPRETSKRTPEADDINGIVAIYPPAADPGVCARPSSDNGCSLGRRDAAPGALALLALAALALLLRRKR